MNSAAALCWCVVGALGFVPLAVLPQHGVAQVIAGIVQDSATAAPIVGASVVQVHDEDTERVLTDAGGRFRLRPRGVAPFELLIERLGYVPKRVRVDDADVAPRLLEIRLVARAVILPELDVTANRARLEFRLGAFLVTEDGIFRARHLYQGCWFLALDSVVIRDPRLLLPEARNYSPARLFLDERGGLGSSARSFPSRSEIPDARLRRDAWPCNVATFIHGPDHLFLKVPGRRVDLPQRVRPGPDAPVYDLVAATEIHLASSISAGSPELAAVAADGTVAVAWAGSGTLRVVGSDLARADSLSLSAAPAGLGVITRVGWLGDTLWVSDAAQRRIVLVPPGAAPNVRSPPTLNPVPDTIQGAATDRFDPELQIPIPVAGGRWLAVQRAAAAPYPPRMQDEPARRRLAVVDAAGNMESVLGILRPGPWRLDLGTPDTPFEPFRDHPLYAVDPDGDHVTIVQRAFEVAVWMEIYTVTRVGLDADTVFHVERHAPLIPISESAFAATAMQVASHASVVDALPQTEIRQLLVEKTLYRPRYHPPISKVMAGRDGSTWLRWPDERTGTVRWDVLDTRGQPLRTVMADRRLDIVAANGESVWALLPNDGGVRLIRYRLRMRN